MFTSLQVKSTIRPNIFTTQDAGIYSNAQLDMFWNRILFSKLSDSTLHFLEKAVSYSFNSSNTPNDDAYSRHDNPYSTLRISLLNKFSNLTPLFTPILFPDASISLFGYPCNILCCLCGNVIYMFLHFVLYKQPLHFF